MVIALLIGKNLGRNEATVNVINNTAIIKEIAELSALDVEGTATINTTNKADNNSAYGQLKNIFFEKTLNFSVPYQAKYGIDMSNQNIRVDDKKGTVDIYLPPVKLLTMELKLDKALGMDKTGLLYQISLDDFMKVQQKLYRETNASLLNNDAYKRLGENHIKVILERYYVPLGYKVNCVFAKEEPAKL